MCVCVCLCVCLYRVILRLIAARVCVCVCGISVVILLMTHFEEEKMRYFMSVTANYTTRFQTSVPRTSPMVDGGSQRLLFTTSQS